MQSRSRLRTLLICALIILSASACMAKTVYVKTTGLDTNDGLSWDTAKKTVTAGIAASVSGDEIWVAVGTYLELITLRLGTSLYGGFTGTETERSQRDFHANVTILDGGNSNTVVAVAKATRLDGFVIQNGQCGIDCNSSTATVANNVVRWIIGQGIRCRAGSTSTVVNNVIIGSFYGIASENSSPTIINNTISGNRAGDGAGIYLTTASSSLTIANNIIAHNISGICSLSGTPALDNNCVYGNAMYDYSAGLAPGATDIAVDPKLASVDYSNLHIQAVSPCVDAGNNDHVISGTNDMDDQDRIWPAGGTVDIGADESRGDSWQGTPSVVRVTPTGSDANDGSTWDDAHAKKTVQAAINMLVALGGGEVWVKAGTYYERITLARYVYVYGGFGGNETGRTQRDWDANLSILDGQNGGVVVRSTDRGYNLSTIDGFTIRNGKHSSGGGVYCGASSSPSIANNTITACSTTSSGGGINCGSSEITNNRITGCSAAAYGGGISSGGAVITGNTIGGNTAPSGAGLSVAGYCHVAGNTIADNTATTSGGGIYCGTSSQGRISIKNNIISGNIGANGSAINCSAAGISVANNIINLNTTTGSGGSVYCSGYPVSITHNAFSGNSGGVYCTNSSSNITGNTIAWSTQSAISCRDSSPTIAGNMIHGNSAGQFISSGYGGGISCYGGQPVISNNTVAGNMAGKGGGIFLSNVGGAVRNNTISANGSKLGAGIYCNGTAAPTISNNTIVSNVGSDSVYIETTGAAAIANNIIAYNAAGVCSMSVAPILCNNCVFGNTKYDYSTGLPAGVGDISADPRLVCKEYGDYHILSTSPCVDAGNNGMASAGWVDMDGQPRVQPTDAVVDIGADESNGTTWPIVPAIVYVSPEGDDSSDGTSWTRAKKTVQAGVNAARGRLAEVWVRAGTYAERVGLPPCMHLYGGFAGTEDAREQRDWTANPTILDGQHGGPVVSIAAGAPISTTIDGLSIVNGKNNYYGGGVSCLDSGSVTIKNSEIMGNSASYGGGVWCSEGASVCVENCTVSQNTATYGGGAFDISSGIIHRSRILANKAVPRSGQGASAAIIRCLFGSLSITDSLIAHNDCSHAPEGCTVGGRLTFANNRAIGNWGGALLRCYDALIHDNVFAQNSGAVNCSSTGSSVVTNNTFVGHSSSAVAADSTDVIRNNIFAYNQSSVSYMATQPPTMGHNCSYGNESSGPADMTPANGNISADPLFASRGYGNFHIQPGSPCVGAGDATALGDDWKDMDGQSRVLPSSGVVDIGADESDDTIWPEGPYAVIRVTPTGNDGNDGTGWDDAHAMRGIQAAVFSAAEVGGDVWAKTGVYNGGVLLTPYVYMYGGFSGTESDRSQRDWRSNITILDGQQTGDVVTACAGDMVSAIDGFTIRNGIGHVSGPVRDGGGVYSPAAITIRNNVITGNSAHMGGGVWCVGESSVIADNTVTGNSGVGIHCGVATVTGNTITENSIGGLVCAAAVVDNNVISENGDGSSPSYGGISCGAARITNNVISNNDAASANSQGGAISCWGQALISNNDMTGNSGLAGAIHCDAASPTIESNRIIGNSGVLGGAIYVRYTSTPVIADNIIAANTASSLGGAIYCLLSTPQIINNTIVCNSSPSSAGCIASANCSPVVKNNIVAFNSSGVYKQSGTGAPCLENNDVFGNTAYNYSGLTAGTGDISLDPLFVDRANGDYHLTAASPCINMGSNSALGLPAFDFEGKGRIFGGTVDIGADEYWSSVFSATDTKKAPEGAVMKLSGSTVSRGFNDFFYIEADDRSGGIRVDRAGFQADEDSKVSITGKVKVSGAGEAFIAAETVVPGTEIFDIKPMFLTSSHLGGGEIGLQDGVWNRTWYRDENDVLQYGWLESAGMNNIGLLVSAIGKVTFAGTGFFYLDDGSKIDDGSGHVGVKVLADGFTFPDHGFVKVTGIVSCEKSGDKLLRILRVSKQSDIVPL